MATKNVRKVAVKIMKAMEAVRTQGVAYPSELNWQDRFPRSYEKAQTRVARLLRRKTGARDV
jgi:hypothetical protein